MMYINEMVPAGGKCCELLKYEIFIMRVFEFILSVALMVMPFYLPKAMDSKKTGFNMECISTAPTLVLSLMFIILYIVDQVQNLIEQMYLMTQITMNIAAGVVLTLEKRDNEKIYAIFHMILVLLLFIDLMLIICERGYALCRKIEDEICQEVCEPLKFKKKTCCGF